MLHLCWQGIEILSKGLVIPKARRLMLSKGAQIDEGLGLLRDPDS